VSTPSALLARGVRAAAPARRAAAVVLLLTLAAAAWQPAHAGDAAAAGVGLAALLAAVAQHPGLRAADAAADAAALRADAVRSPVSLRLDLESQRLRVEDASDPLPPPFDDLFAIDDATDRATVTAVLRPFVAGEVRDLLDQRLLDLERAELTLRETRAALEAQAVRAAAGVLLAERGVALAATPATSATGRWRRRGRGTRRARRATSTCAGPSSSSPTPSAASRAPSGSWPRPRRRCANSSAPRASPTSPTLTPVLGAPPDLVRAALDLALADVGARNQGRALLPTVQAGYTWLGDDGDQRHGRPREPLVATVAHVRDRQRRPGGGWAASAAASAATRSKGSRRASAGASRSASAGPSRPRRARARREPPPGRRGRRGARGRARPRGAAAPRRRGRARRRPRSVLQAELERSLAIEEAAAAALRFDAGLIGALERDQAHLALTQAELGWWASRVDALGAVLDTYVAYAIPLSEVLP
jgi:outer membrane protein